MPKELDDIQEKLVEYYKTNDVESGVTLRQIASEIGANHPQTVLNKLNQLVKKGIFLKDEHGFRLIKDTVNSIFNIPVYGMAQCGHAGPEILSQYSQEQIPVTFALVGTSDLENCFFVRAKGKSMEPKINDGDLVLIRQQQNYDPNNYVLVAHNDIAKLKKIKEKDSKKFLISVNTDFMDVEIDEFDKAAVIGVVTKVIKSM